MKSNVHKNKENLDSYTIDLIEKYIITSARVSFFYHDPITLKQFLKETEEGKYDAFQKKNNPIK